jgi:predicted chitinase
VTSEQLQRIMPGLAAPKRDQFFPFLKAAMGEFGIDTPAREAAFVAQLAHESGQLRFMEEIWGPTDAQRRYEPASTLATKLGNTQTGDGKRFKGRGPIQITGRSNYGRFGNLLSLDLLAAPERAAVPDTAFRIAGLFWQKNGLNELADQVTADAFREITRRINGGFNGLKDREQFYATARSVLGVAARATRSRAPMPGGVPMDPPLERGHEAVVQETRRKPARKRKPAKAKRSTSRKPAKGRRSGSRKPARRAASRKTAKRGKR